MSGLTSRAASGLALAPAMVELWARVSGSLSAPQSGFVLVTLSAQQSGLASGQALAPAKEKRWGSALVPATALPWAWKWARE